MEVNNKINVDKILVKNMRRYATVEWFWIDITCSMHDVRTCDTECMVEPCMYVCIIKSGYACGGACVVFIHCVDAMTERPSLYGISWHYWDRSG